MESRAVTGAGVYAVTREPPAKEGHHRGDVMRRQPGGEARRKEI